MYIERHTQKESVIGLEGKVEMGRDAVDLYYLHLT